MVLSFVNVQTVLLMSGILYNIIISYWVDISFMSKKEKYGYRLKTAVKGLQLCAYSHEINYENEIS